MVSKLSNAQGEVALYNFLGTNGCTSLSATYGLSNTTNSAISFTSPVVCSPVESVLSTSPWTDISINTSKYIEFTSTANNCFILNLTELQLFQSVSSGTATYYVRSSLDNFSSNLASGAVTTTGSSGSSIGLPASFSNINTITFRLYLSNGSSNWNIDAIDLRGLVDPMTPTSVNSSTICNGQSTTITASDASTYSWSTGATTASIIISPTTNTSYTVTGTTNSCSTKAISTVTVNPIPSMSSTNTMAICSAVPVNFNFTSNVPSTYSWKATDNTSVTGESTVPQTSGILTDVITNTTAVVQKVTYTVTPTSQTGNCGGIPQTFSVTVNPQPTMTSTNAKTICTGTAVGLPLTSNITSSYNWIASDNPSVTGESTILQTGATITNTLTNTSTAIQYVTYTVTPTAVSCNGTPQIVTIALMPKPIVTSPSTTGVCSGNAVNLALTANVPSNYTWLASDNTNVTGESLTSQTTALITNTLTTALTIAQNVTYTITPTSQSGTCPGTAQTLTVTVNPKPSMSSASIKTICSGSMVNLALTSSVTSTYSWKATDNTNITGESTSAQTSGTISDILNNITTTAQAVTYTITPTSNAGGCIGTLQTATVTIYPNPTMTSANTKVLCSNTSVGLTFTSNIASSYNWLATDNANVTGESTSLQTGTIITNTLVTMGTTPQLVSYSVTPVSTTGLCPGPLQVVTVTVNPLPVMTSTNNVTVCNSNVVNLNFTSTIPGTYSWKATDNTSVTGESVSAVVSAVLNNTLSTTSAAIQNVSYTVTPTSQTSGCTGTVQTLTVVVVPKATVTSASAITVCSGQTLNLALTASIPSAFTWLSATNANVSGQSTSIQNTNVINNTLTNTSTAIQKITYTITPTSISGLCVGTPQTLTVTINPLPTLTNTNTAVICSGNALNITLTTTIPSTYSWIASDNTNITGESTTAQTTTSITNTLVSSSASSQIVTYTVTPIATSTLGACTGLKQQITVTVNPKPAMTSNNVVTICSGQTLNFALGSNVSSTYNWIATDNISITGESTATQNTNAINNTLVNTSTTVQKVTYSVTPISIGGNCIGTIQTVTITVNPAPAMTNVSAKTICTGTAVGLSLTSNIASSFIWQASDNVNVTGESTAQQTTTSITNTLTSSSVLVETVTYSVIPTATTGLCVGVTQLVTIAVSPKPTISSVLNPPAICSGAPVNYIVTSATPNALFSWRRSVVTGISQPASSGTGNINEVLSNTTTTLVSVSYTYTTSINGCSGNPQNVVVGVKPLFSVSSIGLTSAGGTNNQTKCVNTAITPITYSVSAGLTGVSAAGLPAGVTTTFNSNILTISGTPSVAGTFNYTLSTSSGCLQSPPTGTITVNSLPTVGSTVSPSATVCSGTSVTLSGTGASSYSWTGGVTNGVAFTPTVSATYTVTGTAANGCVNITTRTITVNALPTVSITVSPDDTVAIGTSIILNGMGAFSYLWTGGITNGVAFTPTVSATYTVTGTSANGCVNTAIRTITVVPLGFWQGTTSSDWFTASNWGGLVPSKNIDVFISSPAPHMPNISGATGAECRSIMIDSGAVLTTSTAKNLDVYGDFMNFGTYIPNNGSITFRGDTNQSIFGDTTTFSNLFINKTGLLSLNTAVIISDSLSLIKGKIVTAGGGILQLSDNARSSSGSDSSYVSGPMKKTGNDIFTFPVGDTLLITGAYHPLSITAPSSVTDVFVAQYTAKGQSITAIPVIQSDSLESISNCENWLLFRENGSSVVIPSLGWNANSCNVGENQDLRISGWDGSQWVSMGNTKDTAYGNKGTIKGAHGINVNFLPLVLGRFGSFTINTVGMDTLPSIYDTLKYNIYGVPGISGIHKSGTVVTFNHAQVADTGNTVTISFFGFPLPDSAIAGSDSIKMLFDINKFKKASNLRVVKGDSIFPMDSVYFFADKQVLALLNGKSRYEDQLPPPLNIMLDGGILMSPNNDNSFDNFVVISNVPVSSYHLQVLDINSAVIFETSSISQLWNGKNSGNNLVPVGNYFYNIDFNGQSIKGQFLVEY